MADLESPKTDDIEPQQDSEQLTKRQFLSRLRTFGLAVLTGGAGLALDIQCRRKLLPYRESFGLDDIHAGITVRYSTDADTDGYLRMVGVYLNPPSDEKPIYSFHLTVDSETIDGGYVNFSDRSKNSPARSASQGGVFLIPDRPIDIKGRECFVTISCNDEPEHTLVLGQRPDLALNR